jgi:hypothetical protein
MQDGGRHRRGGWEFDPGTLALCTVIYMFNDNLIGLLELILK